MKILILSVLILPVLLVTGCSDSACSHHAMYSDGHGNENFYTRPSRREPIGEKPIGNFDWKDPSSPYYRQAEAQWAKQSEEKWAKRNTTNYDWRDPRSPYHRPEGDYYLTDQYAPPPIYKYTEEGEIEIDKEGNLVIIDALEELERTRKARKKAKENPNQDPDEKKKDDH